MNSIYIFGYGSLLNPASRARTFTELQVFENVLLKGYQRKLNATSPNWPEVAMNIVKNPAMSILGVVAEVSLEDFPKLQAREEGYEQVEVTGELSVPFEVPVFTFIAPDQHHGDKKAYKTYLDTCLGGVPKEHHQTWLKETIIECEILDDSGRPLYLDLA